MADLDEERTIACCSFGCTATIVAGILAAVEAGWLVHEAPDGKIYGDCPRHAGPGGRKLAAAVTDHFGRN